MSGYTGKPEVFYHHIIHQTVHILGKRVVHHFHAAGTGRHHHLHRRGINEMLPVAGA